MIIYKKTDEWYIKWQRVVQRVTTGDTTSDNEWYNECQRVTTSDKEWQRVTRQTSGTTSDTDWQRVEQRVTANDNEWYKEWQRLTISANVSFFQIREEPTTKHPKENSLNLQQDLWRMPIELRAETSS